MGKESRRNLGGLLKMNDDRHDFTELESRFALSFECSRFEKFEFEMGLKVEVECGYS
jgi:hypothetical protein